jgi:hypothetical protein
MSQEIWKEINGFEGIYNISNRGRLMKVNFLNTGSSKILKNRKNNYYYIISLVKDKKIYIKYIHRLVAEHFVENSENFKYIKFIDGDNYNCDYKNLQWSKFYNTSSKKIRCIETGIVFDKVSHLAKKMRLNIDNINKVLQGDKEFVGRNHPESREYFSFEYLN